MPRIRQPLIAIRNKIRLALVAICLSFLAFTASAAAAEFDIDLRALQELLNARDFDTLEQRFADLEQTYAAGGVSDRVIERGYRAFGVADPELEARLDGWVAAKPNSHRPYIALGFYHRNLGWTYRGGGFASETSGERFSIMRLEFKKARDNLRLALDRRPESGVAYAKLIDMAMATSDVDGLDQFVRAGLTADPKSFTVRRNYFTALLPWWGGHRRDGSLLDSVRPLTDTQADTQVKSYPVKLPDAMRQYARHVERDAIEVPALQPLQGMIEFAAGEILRRDGRELEAARFFKNATAFGGFWFFHYQEGRNFHGMERYRDAIVSYNRALDLWPDNVFVLGRRARSLRKLEAYDRALADLVKAVSIDPNDPDLLRDLNFTLRDVDRTEDALAAIEKAFVYGEHDVTIWDARARTYLYGLNDPAHAIPDTKRTTELGPRVQSYWYNYGHALYGVRDCKAVKAFKKFLAVCPRFDNKCRDNNKKFAREVIEYMSHPGHCGN